MASFLMLPQIGSSGTLIKSTSRSSLMLIHGLFPADCLHPFVRERHPADIPESTSAALLGDAVEPETGRMSIFQAYHTQPRSQMQLDNVYLTRLALAGGKGQHECASFRIWLDPTPDSHKGWSLEARL